MSLKDEIDTLRQHLDRLASETDDALHERFELKRPPMPPGLYWRLRWLAGSILRWLEEKGLWRRDRWPASLKNPGANAAAKPMLIWALGIDRDTLRAACDGISRLQGSLPGFAPVLITDVADFAFFSRLGWLVEYVPRLSGEGESYDERKAKFLARLYHGAAAVPLSIGLESDRWTDDVRRHILRNA